VYAEWLFEMPQKEFSGEVIEDGLKNHAGKFGSLQITKGGDSGTIGSLLHKYSDNWITYLSKDAKALSNCEVII
jgi:hypothetical protein